MTLMECDTCRAKPGTPLCRGCLHNREMVESLVRNLSACQARAQRLTDSVSNWRTAHTKLEEDIKMWRHNYRATLGVLHDENNLLRSIASSLSAKLHAKDAPRSLLEKFFNLPKD